jgi:light-independent protochlorophyllide reductase subunit N
MNSRQELPLRSAVADHEAPLIAIERGQRSVFCGLTSIVWLHRKIQDAFFLVVGSRTCAHLLQSAAGVMIFAEPRFATAVLEDRDLAGMADCAEEVERMIDQIVRRRPNIKTLFLVSSCPSEVIKIDLDNIAKRYRERNPSALRVLAYSGSGIETTFTQGEDSCLLSLLGECTHSTESPAELLVLGSLSDIVEDQFLRLFNSLGIHNVHFFPRRHTDSFPAIGPNTKVIMAQPYLGDSTRAIMAKGAELISAPFPYGAEGTNNWFRAIASAFNVAPALVDEVLTPAFERAQRAVQQHKGTLAGKRITFLADSQLEMPLARFLASECAMIPLEVAMPFYDALTMAGEAPYLPADVSWIEGQNVDDALNRVRTTRPDITVCGLGLANPLEAEGLRTKWSIELLFSPIQGFEQAGDLAELFARPLRREAILEVNQWN